MKIAFVFAGQGSQYVGMGKELYESHEIVKKIFDNADADFNIKDICFNGPNEVLNNTAYTQACIFTTSYAIASLLKEKKIIPEFVAGLSLGEYSALCFSNAVDFNDGLKIVSQRGEIMAKALKDSDSGMMAILNLDWNLLEKLCLKENVEVANYNSNAQVVVSGKNKNLKALSLKIKENGGRGIALKVSGAFHSSLLNDASLQLEKILHEYKFNNPQFRVVFNTLGTESKTDIKKLLSRQINHSVYFKQSIEYMILNGVDTFIEIGPGKVLSGFIKNINSQVRVFNVEDNETLNRLIKELGL